MTALVILLVVVGVGALAAALASARRPAAAPAAPVSAPAAPTAPAAPGSIEVTLGNTAVAQVLPTPDAHGLVAPRRVARPDLGNRVTTVGPFPAPWTRHEVIKALVHAWSHHSDAAPAWLESNDAALAQEAATELKCPIGRPDDWQESE